MSERAAPWRRAFSGAGQWLPQATQRGPLAVHVAYASHLRSALALLAAALAFGAFVTRATTLGMPHRPPVWVVDAVPAALSDVLFGRTTPYTSLAVVIDSFASLIHTDAPPADGPTVNAAMASIAAQLDPATVDRAYRLLGPDDKGIVDFVSLALRVFGLRVEGVFWLYVAVLGASSALFALAYLRRPAVLALLSCFLLLLYLVVPMLAFNPQVGSLLALRVFPVLSMVACLHALLFVAQPSASAWQIGLLATQVALIIFVEHVRSTTAWQLVVLVLVAVGVSAFRLRQRRGWRLVVLTCCPLALVVVGQVALDRYRAWVYPIEYQRGDQILTRGVWHNVFSGFALQPEMAERYQLKIDDVSTMSATGQYLQESGRGQEWLAMGGASAHFAGLRWAPYDQAVRDMLVARCTAAPGPCLEAVTVDKPRGLLGDLAWAYGLVQLPTNLDVFTSPEVGDTVKNQVVEATQRLDQTGLRAHPWSPVLLLLSILLIWTMVGGRPGEIGGAALAVGALWAGSLLPSLIGYPAPHAIAEPAIATGLLVVFSLSTLAARGLSRIRLR